MLYGFLENMGVNIIMGRGLSIYISSCCFLVLFLLLYRNINVNPQGASWLLIGMGLNAWWIISNIIKHFKEKK